MASLRLAVIVAASLLTAPLFQRRLNEQFMRGAATQAFITEYVSAVETVKSLQQESQVNRRYQDLLATLLFASFRTRQLGNTYGTVASSLEQVMTLLYFGRRCLYSDDDCQLYGRHAGCVSDVLVQNFTADAATGQLVAAISAGSNFCRPTR